MQQKIVHLCRRMRLCDLPSIGETNSLYHIGVGRPGPEACLLVHFLALVTTFLPFQIMERRTLLRSGRDGTETVTVTSEPVERYLHRVRSRLDQHHCQEQSRLFDKMINRSRTSATLANWDVTRVLTGSR